MPRNPSYEGLVRIYLNLREEGLTGRQLQAHAQARVPGLDPQWYADAAADSLRLARVVRRGRMLAPDAPLSQALGSEQPPSANVDVRVLVTIHRPPGQPDLNRTIIVNVPWGTTAGDAGSMAVDAARQSLNYGTIEGVSTMLIGPLWWG